MFFVFSKILLFLVSPFVWFCSLCLAALIFRPTKWKRRFAYSAFTVFILFTNTVVFSEFCRTWEYQGQKIGDTKTHDIAILLGGMAEYNSDLEVLSIRRQGDRLVQTLSLYHQGKVKKILITGDSGYLTDRGLHEAKQIKHLLLSWGIPEEDLLTEERSVNTYENAQNTAALLQKKGLADKRLLLVTSGIHMKRALACFKKSGLTCTPHATDLYTGTNRNYFLEQYFIPELDNFNQWALLLKEITGYMAYAMMGYL